MQSLERLAQGAVAAHGDDEIDLPMGLRYPGGGRATRRREMEVHAYTTAREQFRRPQADRSTVAPTRDRVRDPASRLAHGEPPS